MIARRSTRQDSRERVGVPAHRERPEHEQPERDARPVEDDRRDQVVAHRDLVDDGVERDRAAGEERESRPLRPVAREEPQRVAGEEIRAENDECGAGEREHARPLAEKEHRGGDGEHRPGRPRERVDHREVAVPVAAVEQEEVDGVDRGARENGQEMHPLEDVALPEPLPGRDRRPDDGCDDGDQRHERRAAAGGLEEVVPARVHRRRDEHERERCSGQGRVLRAPGLSIVCVPCNISATL